MRKLATALGATALVAAMTAPAFAHVTIQPNEALAESFSRFVVRVPNERDDASTIKVQVKFPPLAAVGFMDVEGWDRNVKMQKLDEPMEVFGEEVDEAVGTVTWSGGEIQPNEFAEFGFSALTPAGEEELEFLAVQTYSSGEVVRWTGPPDADTPAPLLSTVELGDLPEGTGQLGALHEVVHAVEDMAATVDELSAQDDTAETPTTAVDEEDDEGDSDSTGIILGSIGIGLGAIALLVSLMKRKA